MMKLLRSQQKTKICSDWKLRNTVFMELQKLTFSKLAVFMVKLLGSQQKPKNCSDWKLRNTVFMELKKLTFSKLAV